MSSGDSKIAGLILAAGKSERMGSPKALMELEGKPAALRHAELLLSAGIAPVHIVLGFDHCEIRKRLSGWDSFVINELWERGQFSSLLAGLAKIPPGFWSVVMPVDTGAVRRETIELLINSLDKNFEAAVPLYRGRKGHPVILSPDLRDFLIGNHDENSRLDYILRSRKVLTVDVEDKGVLSNINKPEDLAGGCGRGKDSAPAGRRRIPSPTGRGK